MAESNKLRRWFLFDIVPEWGGRSRVRQERVAIVKWFEPPTRFGKLDVTRSRGFSHARPSRDPKKESFSSQRSQNQGTKNREGKKDRDETATTG